MEQIRIGFIGAGEHANMAHYPSLTEFEDARIVAACDRDTGRLNTTCDKFGIEKRFTDAEKMLNEVELDAVYVIMQPHHLYDVAMVCLDRGLSVFVEKPPAITTYQLRNMARLAEQRGCKTMVGFNRRYIPLMKEVKKLVGERGPIIQSTAVFYKNQPGYYFNGMVDFFRGDGVHALDTLRWMGGEIARMHSHVGCFHNETPNTFNALVEFESGGCGHLATNYIVGKRVHTFEMHARGISAFVDPNTTAVIYKDNEPEGQVLDARQVAGSDEFYKFYGFYDEDRHFIDCLKSDRQPDTNFSDAVKTMDLADEICHGRV